MRDSRWRIIQIITVLKFVEESLWLDSCLIELHVASIVGNFYGLSFWYFFHFIGNFSFFAAQLRVVMSSKMIFRRGMKYAFDELIWVSVIQFIRGIVGISLAKLSSKLFSSNYWDFPWRVVPKKDTGETKKKYHKRQRVDVVWK